MTKPINLYIQSRISDELSFNRVEFHSSKRQDCGKTKEHEIGSLRKIVDAFIAQGLSPKELDGFFFGFHIPQIGKEFDLLKFSQTEVINIEFKSQIVPEEQILTQLIKNKHYLAHLGKEEFLYTIITDTMTCYELCADNSIKVIDFSVISQKVKTFDCNYLTDIDSMFRASEFLVSPLNTPEKFIRGEYFLTQAQEQIKKRILDTVSNLDTHGFVSLTGRPGTGKTLLLYDIAKELAKKDKTLIIHCGKLADGQDLLNRCIHNFCVVSTAYLKRVPSVINEYKYILLDESHRIYPHQFDEICKSAAGSNKICIFSSDPGQVLSQFEYRNAIFEKIHELPLTAEYELSEKIRTNKELASFIISVRNLGKKPHCKMDYSNVTVAYANTVAEAHMLIDYFRKNDYVFINYSKSNVRYSPYSQYEEDYDTHHVIGQEFDNVLILMDKSFYYDNDGLLQGIPHPNPDYLYPNLFYQGISRVREKIALIVVDAPVLFEKITSVLENEE